MERSSCRDLSLTNSFSARARHGDQYNHLTNAVANLLIGMIIASNGIHIVASAAGVGVWPCYVLGTSDAFTAYPTPMLGTNYCVMARPSLRRSRHFSQFAIVLGTASNTTVTHLSVGHGRIWPQMPGATLLTINATARLDLSKSTAAILTDDVTGTIITSDQSDRGIRRGEPRLCARRRHSGPGIRWCKSRCPVASWGTQALALSFGRPAGDSFRVLAAKNNTSVITPTACLPRTLMPGNFLTPSWQGRWNSRPTIPSKSPNSRWEQTTEPLRRWIRRPLRDIVAANRALFDLLYNRQRDQ